MSDDISVEHACEQGTGSEELRANSQNQNDISSGSSDQAAADAPFVAVDADDNVCGERESQQSEGSVSTHDGGGGHQGQRGASQGGRDSSNNAVGSAHTDSRLSAAIGESQLESVPVNNLEWEDGFGDFMGAAPSSARITSGTILTGETGTADNKAANTLGMPMQDSAQPGSGVAGAHGDDGDDGDWMEFEDSTIATPAPPQPQPSATCTTRLTSNNEFSGKVISLLGTSDDVNLEEEFNITLLTTQLMALTGCTVGSSSNATQANFRTNKWVENVSSGSQGNYASGDIVTAMMEALSFRRLKSNNEKRYGLQGVGNLFVAHECSAAARRLLEVPQSSQHENVGLLGNHFAEERWHVVGETDPITAVRIAELHNVRFFSSSRSVLMDPSTFQSWEEPKGPVPVSDIIAKVKALNAERKSQQGGSQPAHVWEARPLLPTPCIGGSVSQAPSLRLPL
uniref:Uncharacterized protein n=1 Tax=Trypanosoma congolense (strain IL3000) TaxID=1068625 RepID=G0UVX3_TRYCI|nr:conserved hypothetical protein [Trypanosoma congolense IL3000]